jgi:DNA modification methylase
MNVDLRHGDCVELMRAMPDCSVDSIVTDPPYELAFMGRRWDASGIAYSLEMWGEALRVLKPGGHLLAFGGTRTYHRMACAIEDAGFEIRDSIHWVYGSGFPKSLNVGKAIDKAAGAERQVIGRQIAGIAPGAHNYVNGPKVEVDVKGGPVTPDAARWEGWGTALKPAHEPIVVARKPLAGTVAGNVLVWGTGGLNIDGCRVGTTVETWPASRSFAAGISAGYTDGLTKGATQATGDAPAGRWPANVVFDRTAGEALDQQSGVSASREGGRSTRATTTAYSNATGTNMFHDSRDVPRTGHSDTGGASRFFTQADFGPDDWPFVYQAKPSRRERNAGLDGLPEQPGPDGMRRNLPAGESGGRGLDRQNHHPTVKPVALMRHLVRLVTPPGGTVLDPFAGSGTTLVAAVLEGFDAIGCEMTDEYLPIIEGRVAWAQAEVEARAANPEQPTLL